MWQKAFPDFPAADMPAIPADWQDYSDRNDACPSFVVAETGEDAEDGARYRVWVDYADPTARDFPDGPRYMLTREWFDGHGPDTLAEGDDWDAILSAVDRVRAGIAPGG